MDPVTVGFRLVIIFDKKYKVAFVSLIMMKPSII